MQPLAIKHDLQPALCNLHYADYTSRVIADKKDDLVQGQILMLCIDGRAKGCLDQFEDAKKEPQKYSALKGFVQGYKPAFAQGRKI